MPDRPPRIGKILPSGTHADVRIAAAQRPRLAESRAVPRSSLTDRHVIQHVIFRRTYSSGVKPEKNLKS